jgi:hypothetical protein
LKINWVIMSQIEIRVYITFFCFWTVSIVYNNDHLFIDITWRCLCMIFYIFWCFSNIYIYIYVWKLNQTVLELDFRAVKFLFNCYTGNDMAHKTSWNVMYIWFINIKLIDCYTLTSAIISPFNAIQETTWLRSHE